MENRSDVPWQLHHRLKSVMGWIAILLVAALIVCPMVAIFVGPASNLYAIGSLHSLSSEHPGGRVFVRNPELAEELEILRASGVFEIVSADKADTVVELHPKEQAGACGNPLLLTWATGGLVPSTVRIGWTFSFTLEEDGVARNSICTSRGTTSFTHSALSQAVSQRYANLRGHSGIRVRMQQVVAHGQAVAVQLARSRY